MYDEFLKIFYHKNHRDFVFCDCYGICYLFNKEILKIELPLYLNERIHTYDDISNTLMTRKTDFKKVQKGKEVMGDIVMLNVKNMPVHVGVVLQNGLMLHIMEGKHAVIESYNNNNWKKKVDSFYRYESTN